MTDLEHTADAAPAIPDQDVNKSLDARRWNDLYNLAKLIADTEIVPPPLRKRPDAVFAIMASADERGIAPLTGLQNIDLINGKPAPSAMLQRSMINRAGHILIWERADDQAAVLYGRRRNDGTEWTGEFTIEHARQQKLLEKPQWRQNPRAMLMARVTSLVARAIFADVVLGMEYTPEELGAVGPYAAVDLDYDPHTDRHVMVDPETGEIFDDDDDEIDDDTPAHVIQATMLDAEDAADAQWLLEAQGRADQLDLLEEEDGDAEA